MPSTLNGDAANPEILEVWQYMMETEKEVCREAEEALKLQEKDTELKRKLQEIKANRDTSKRHHETKISNGDLSDEDNEDKIADKVIQQVRILFYNIFLQLIWGKLCNVLFLLLIWNNTVCEV